LSNNEKYTKGEMERQKRRAKDLLEIFFFQRHKKRNKDIESYYSFAINLKKTYWEKLFYLLSLRRRVVHSKGLPNLFTKRQT
jgi:hypothetical protein